MIRVNDTVCLKALVRSDAITLYQMIDRQRKHLGKWLPFVQFMNRQEDIEEFVSLAISEREMEKDFVYKICLDDRLIGLVGTKQTDHINKSTELGYWLSEDHQNSGIMTQSVDTLIQALYTNLGLERIQICCAKENRKSIAIPHRLGFQLEGVKRHGEWLGNHQFRDLLVFSKLKSEASSFFSDREPSGGFSR